MKSLRQTKRLRVSNVTVTTQEFVQMLDLIKGKKDTYVQHRRTIALLLLYVTGLSTDILLSLSKQEVKTLFEGKSIEIEVSSFGWGEKTNVVLLLTSKGVSLVKRYESSFNRISKEKKNASYLFSKEEEQNKHLSLEVFERDLAILLRDYSKTVGNRFNIRSLTPSEELFVLQPNERKS